MLKTLKEELQVVFERDPAARTVLEVILCYPGLHAILSHRLAHWLWTHHMKLLARFLSHLSRHFTQIEIHPGAQIGKRLFIDHGAGVVIGETAEVGDDVTLYQGVTLGGTGKEKGKRHPTIGNNVTISAGAKLLGSFTVGDHAKVGGGSVVLRSVPANCTIVGVPGRIVVQDGAKVEDQRVEIDLEHHMLPDPLEDLLTAMQNRIDSLEARLGEFEKGESERADSQYFKRTQGRIPARRAQ